jgi:CRP/FNR family transcriptional regulator, dissimilatory nitrate respiration regulator
MRDLREIISDTMLFSGLPPEQLDAISGIARERRFQRGELIFSEGDEGNGFYVIADGRVKIFKVSPEGKEQILHIFGDGEPFGEVPVFTGRSFPATAEAITASHLIFFPRTAFVDLISAMPSLALNLLAILSFRLHRFTDQIENLSLKEVPGRLAAYLIDLSDEHGGTDDVTLSVSKRQLASLLGTIPETLSRIFGKMSGRGIIRVNGAEIRIVDRDALADLAEYGKLSDD